MDPVREPDRHNEHLDQRGPGEAAGPVAGADGVERPERRVHDRRLETTFGAVDVERVGYGRAGHDWISRCDRVCSST